jgi:RNA polymerase sigma factor (sigma-70 family)
MAWVEAIEQLRSGSHEGVESLLSAVSQCARAQLSQSVDPQFVDDHIQEILIIVLAAIRSGELRNPECLMGFVRTVTRRQAGLHIRNAVLRRRRLVSVELTITPPAPYDDSPDAPFALRERVDIVGRVLDQLCARDKEILVRFYYHEQSSQDICAEMHLTPTQFRLFKSRALAKCFELRDGPAYSARQSTRPLRIA